MFLREYGGNPARGRYKRLSESLRYCIRRRKENRRTMNASADVSAVTADAHATTKQLRLIRLQEVMARTSLSRPYLYKLTADGRFPPLVKVGAATMWVEHEVEAWIEARIAECRKGSNAA